MIACNNVLHLVEVKTTKKIFGPNLGQNGPKPGPKLVFLPFSQVWFIIFLLSCMDDTICNYLGQFLTTSRGKTCKKILCAQIWAKQAKIGSKIRVLVFSQIWFISLPL